MEEQYNLDDIVIRGEPRKSKTQVISMIKEDGPVCELWKQARAKGREYMTAVFKYLKVYATYKYHQMQRDLITDLEKIYTGIGVASTLDPTADVRAIREREKYGSWDSMLQDLDDDSERPLYQMADKTASRNEKARILQLKRLEKEHGIDLADFCLAI